MTCDTVSEALCLKHAVNELPGAKNSQQAGLKVDRAI